MELSTALHRIRNGKKTTYIVIGVMCVMLASGEAVKTSAGSSTLVCCVLVCFMCCSNVGINVSHYADLLWLEGDE